jgi:hypothetical protein
MPDNRINGLMYSVRHSHEAAKETAQERVYHRRTEGHEDVAQAAQVLTLFTDDGIPQQTPFHEVQTRAFSILAAPQSDCVADHLTTAITCDATAFQWEHLDAVAQQGKRHLRPLLQRIAWASSAAQAPLIEAVEFLQAAFAQGRPLRQYPAWALPRRCIPDTAQRYGEAPGAGEHRQLLPDRDEFRVYRLLGPGLEAGHILCRDRVRCRSFADDRLDDQTWQAKEPLRAHAGRPLLTQPIRAH